MKVLIEVVGNETKSELLAASGFLANLAKARSEEVEKPSENAANDETSASVMEKAVNKAKTARARSRKVESEPQPEPQPEPQAVKPDPQPEPQPQVEEKPEPEPQTEEKPEPQPEPQPEPEPQAEAEEAPATLADCRAVAMQALNQRKKDIVKEAFESVGATAFPNLKAADYGKFIAYIKERL